MGEVVRGRATCEAGARDWRLYVPSGYQPSAPPMMLVFLHGCTQSADDVARGLQMDAVAEAHGFLALYPEQPVEANPKTCWNWFDASQQARGSGEPAIIASMIEDVLAEYPADPARVHIAGISAGAAMATIVAVAYAERFATLSSLSGVPWGGATNVMRALTVMANGAGDELPGAEAMVQAMGRHPYAMPVLAVHGGRDAVVSPRNVEEIVTQWTSVHALLRARKHAPVLEQRPTTEDEVGGYTVHRTEWHAAEEGPQVVRVVIDELGHACSGGSTEGSFADARGPSSSEMIAEFCVPHRRRHV